MPPPPGQFPAPLTTPEQLTEAIDWALAENERPGSPWYGRIDPEQIAVSGFSCGGLQALNVAADPRIDTLIIMNSGQFTNSPAVLSGMNNSPDIIYDIHGGTYHEENGGRVAKVVVDWLQWQLRHDVDAAATFLGEDCRLCTDPDWTLETKFRR